MSAHTPGPWEPEIPFGEPGLYIQGSDTSLICKMSYPGSEQTEANARLIAAAPELFKAAVVAVSLLHTADRICQGWASRNSDANEASAFIAESLSYLRNALPEDVQIEVRI